MSIREGQINRRRFSSAALAGAASMVHVSAALSRERATKLFAGAAETVATPAAEGTFLIGPMKASTGINDELYARALEIGDGETRVAIVTLDYLGFDFAFTQVLLDAASEASGIPAKRILLNCSHTHNAPLTAPWGPWKEHRGQSYHAMLPKKVAKVVRQASDNLQPVRIRFRSEPTQIGFNRRLLHDDKIVMAPNPKGAVLPWVDVLSVERQDGTPIAVLFSHAAHPVIVHESSTLISADYPGFAVQHLKRTRGKETVYLFAQGCSGNINGFPLKGGIGAAAAAGRDLGDAVNRAVNRMRNEQLEGAIRHQASEIQLPLQAPPSVEVCRKMMEREQRPDRRMRFAELLAIAQAGKRRTMRMPLQALAIGELCILAMAHEPFAEYHHYVNEASPFKHNMVLGYTNGLECYVGTKADYDLGEQGGYETSPRGAAFMFESRLPLAGDSERHLKKTLKIAVQSV